MPRWWRVAMAVAVVAGLLTLTNGFLQFQRTGHVPYHKIGLAIGVPVLFYALLRGSRKST